MQLQTLLTIWVVLTSGSLLIAVLDLYRNQPNIPQLMKIVWTLTVLYSGPVGLGIYWFAGREQISADSLWRRGLRSTAHCYSGCGFGEVLGIFVGTAILGIYGFELAALTFSLAFLFGYALTVGPLLQNGVPLPEAVTDTLYTETGSIAVMEIAAISFDLFATKGGTVSLTDPLFFTSLFLSLSVGYWAAYPVNLLLLRFGVKSGMGDPTDGQCHG